MSEILQYNTRSDKHGKPVSGWTFVDDSCVIQNVSAWRLDAQIRLRILFCKHSLFNTFARFSIQTCPFMFETWQWRSLLCIGGGMTGFFRVLSNLAATYNRNALEMPKKTAHCSRPARKSSKTFDCARASGSMVGPSKTTSRQQQRHASQHTYDTDLSVRSSANKKNVYIYFFIWKTS